MKTLRILLIEDNPGDVHLIEEILKKPRGVSSGPKEAFAIEVASTLASGLEILAHAEHDLVLLDLGLPDSQGLDTLSTLLSEHTEVPVIVLTIQQQEEMGIRAVKMGAQDYLFKGLIDPHHMLSSIHYALERSNLKERLRESEERYRSLINNVVDESDVGIFILDPGFRIIWMNTAAERFFGLCRDDVIGMDHRILLEEHLHHQFDSPEGFADRVNAVYDDTAIIKSFECHTAGGEESGERWLLYCSKPIATGLYRGGRIEHYTDITAQKNVENALQIANNKLNLLSSVTRHDILNTITALSLEGNLLLDRIIDAGDRKYLAQMIGEIGNIEKQMEFTRIYQDIGINKPEWQCVDSIATAAIPHSLRNLVEIRINTGNLEIFADLMLQRVFYNLYQNAYMHGGHVTEITISYRIEGRSCIIDIDDNGVGIPDDLKNAIFKRGFGSNTGFGLFLIWELLGITGISIRETGVPGRGARFELDIPPGLWRTGDEL